MTAQLTVPYKRTPRPNDDKSLPQYFDNEFRKLEQVIESIEKAIAQIQKATTLPIT